MRKRMRADQLESKLPDCKQQFYSIAYHLGVILKVFEIYEIRCNNSTPSCDIAQSCVLIFFFFAPDNHV